MKKKLLSVILAVAVAFTFSFAMVGTASADTNTVYSATWADDYSSVTIEKGIYGSSTDDTVWSTVGTYTTVRNWNPLTLDITAKVVVSTPIGGEAPAWTTGTFVDPITFTAASNPVDGVKYVDLSGVKLKSKSAESYADFAPTFNSLATFKSCNLVGTTSKAGITAIDKTNTTIKALYAEQNAPEYVTNYSQLSSSEKYGYVPVVNYLSYADLLTSGYDPTSYAEQSFSFESKVLKTVALQGDYDGVIGSFKVEMKILASSPVAKEAEFYLDDATKASNKLESTEKASSTWYKAFTYDGEEHGIAVAGEGLTTTWEQYDADKEEFVSIEKPVIKNVEDSITAATNEISAKVSVPNYWFIATVTDTAGHKVKNVIFIDVEAAPVKNLGFTQESYTFEEGTEIDGMSLVDFSDFYDVDMESINKFANDFLGVKGLISTVGETKITLVYNPNEYDIEDDELLEELGYTEADLAAINNYGWSSLDRGEKEIGYGDRVISMAHLEIVKAEKKEKAENDITAPDQARTYKVSALKKSAKSFALKAEADYGEVTFAKISGSSKLSVKDGKVVVKKGTKKGTYKIKVKAKVKGTEEYYGAIANKTVTVRVKK